MTAQCVLLMRNAAPPSDVTWLRWPRSAIPFCWLRKTTYLEPSLSARRSARTGWRFPSRPRQGWFIIGSIGRAPPIRSVALCADRVGENARDQLLGVLRPVGLGNERDEVLVRQRQYDRTHARRQHHRDEAMVLADSDGEGEAAHGARRLHVAEDQMPLGTGGQHRNRFIRAPGLDNAVAGAP
jgi:hypothetical protein